MTRRSVRILATIALGLIWLATAVPAHAANKYAALILDADTGTVLFERHAKAQRHPASLTKIMTLYMLFDALKDGRVGLEDRLKVSTHAAAQPPSNLHLRAGDTIRVEDAILALVTKSANDVAVVVAEALGGTEYKFARQMTQRARQLGMRNTTFRNASGLHDGRQVTTAYDMAMLALAVRRDFPAGVRLLRDPPLRLGRGGRTTTTTSCSATTAAPTASRPATSAPPGSTWSPRSSATAGG